MSGRTILFVVLAGLLLLTIGAFAERAAVWVDSPSAYPKYRETGDEARKRLPSLSRQEAIKAAVEQEPCRDPQGHDASDLCAQWRAADAAERTSRWTYYQFFIGFFGVAGIGVTLWFNLQAWKQARVANELASDEGRPWVVYKETHVVMSDKDGIGFRMEFANVGSRPADNLRTMAEYLMTDSDAVPDFTEEIPVEAQPSIVAPHQPIFTGRWYPERTEGEDWVAGKRTFWCYAKSTYRDPRTPTVERVTQVMMKVKFMGLDGVKPKIAGIPTGPRNRVT